MNLKKILPLLIIFFIIFMVIYPNTPSGTGWALGVRYKDGTEETTDPIIKPWNITIPVNWPRFAPSLAVYKYGETKEIESLFGDLYLKIDYNFNAKSIKIYGVFRIYARWTDDSGEVIVDEIKKDDYSSGWLLSFIPNSGETKKIYRLSISAYELESIIKKYIQNGDFYIFFKADNFKVVMTDEDGNTYEKLMDHSVISSVVHLVIEDSNISSIELTWIPGENYVGEGGIPSMVAIPIRTRW